MTVLSRLVRDRRRSFVTWSIAMFVLMAFSSFVFPSLEGQVGFEELTENLPESLKALFGFQSGVSIISPPGYLQSRVFSTTVPLVLLLFGIALGARAMGGAEEDGTLELLLTHPITRLRVLAERGTGVFILLGGLTVVAALSLLATSPPVGLLDGVGVVRLLAACAASGSTAALFTALAFAGGCAFGSRGTAVSTAASVAVAGYVLQGLAATVDALRPTRFVNPWHWYLDRNLLVDGVGLQNTLLPLVLAAAFVAAGAWAFLRRDLR